MPASLHIIELTFRSEADRKDAYDHPVLVEHPYR